MQKFTRVERRYGAVSNAASACRGARTRKASRAAGRTGCSRSPFRRSRNPLRAASRSTPEASREKRSSFGTLAAAGVFPLEHHARGSIPQAWLLINPIPGREWNSGLLRHARREVRYDGYRDQVGLSAPCAQVPPDVQPGGRRRGQVRAVSRKPTKPCANHRGARPTANCAGGYRGGDTFRGPPPNWQGRAISAVTAAYFDQEESFGDFFGAVRQLPAAGQGAWGRGRAATCTPRFHRHGHRLSRRLREPHLAARRRQRARTEVNSRRHRAGAADQLAGRGIGSPRQRAGDLFEVGLRDDPAFVPARRP